MYIGWYSTKQAMFGTATYLLHNNKVGEVSELCNEKELPSWDDAVYVGSVATCLKYNKILSLEESNIISKKISEIESEEKYNKFNSSQPNKIIFIE